MQPRRWQKIGGPEAAATRARRRQGLGMQSSFGSLRGRPNSPSNTNLPSTRPAPPQSSQQGRSSPYPQSTAETGTEHVPLTSSRCASNIYFAKRVGLMLRECCVACRSLAAGHRGARHMNASLKTLKKASRRDKEPGERQRQLPRHHRPPPMPHCQRQPLMGRPVWRLAGDGPEGFSSRTSLGHSPAAAALP